MIDVAPGTVVVYSDVGCPWAHLAVHRLRQSRRRLGLEEQVVLDHRAFALEVFNGRPTPKRMVDAELPVVGGLDPGAGWQVWQDEAHRYPVTTLPALEAVQAAKAQGLRASEQLDRRLRVAFFAESRCISMRHVIREVAESCDRVDARALDEALDDGRARRALADQIAGAEGAEVKGSPHLFLPDGTNAHNPGVTMHWEGEHGRGFPVVTADEPAVYEDLLRRAAASAS